MKYILGIDPGLKGGLALYSGDELKTFEMPIITTKIKKKVKGEIKVKIKSEIDEPKLARMIDDWSCNIEKVIIEKVHAMPGQGVTSMFTFGMGYGILKGIIAANFLPIEYVTPQTWKKKLGVPAQKNGARLRASEIFPKNSEQWCKAMWDGRAEAAMIAYYAKNT